jgi:hypothetical protein
MLQELLYITTSNYLFCYDVNNAKLTKIAIHVSATQDFDGNGAFGIDYWKNGRKIVIALRRNLIYSTLPKGKYSSDVSLLFLDVGSPASTESVDITDVLDVHQIAVFGDTVFIIESSRNRVVLYNLISNSVSKYIKIGNNARDENHLHSIHVDESKIYIVYGNCCRSKLDYGGVVILDTETVLKHDGDVPGLLYGSVVKIPNYYFTHDIEPFGEDFLICGSHSGDVFSYKTNNSLFNTAGWCRGIALSKKGIWVGNSPMSDLENRSKGDGEIILFSYDTYKEIFKLKLYGSGQVYDLFLWAGED